MLGHIGHQPVNNELAAGSSHHQSINTLDLTNAVINLSSLSCGFRHGAERNEGCRGCVSMQLFLDGTESELKKYTNITLI